MRLWTIHPSYLDRQGLLAAWREGLLAQKVLEGKTRGYRRHPQLERFRKSEDPLALMGRFLSELADEADLRGFHFDRGKIHGLDRAAPPRVPVAEGQLAYEFALLEAKLAARAPEKLREIGRALDEEGAIRICGAFCRVPGGIEEWERVKRIPENPEARRIREIKMRMKE
jgi:hypothetical protein